MGKTFRQGPSQLAGLCRAAPLCECAKQVHSPFNTLLYTDWVTRCAEMARVALQEPVGQLQFEQQCADSCRFSAQQQCGKPVLHDRYSFVDFGSCGLANCYIVLTD